MPMANDDCPQLWDLCKAEQLKLMQDTVWLASNAAHHAAMLTFSLRPDPVTTRKIRDANALLHEAYNELHLAIQQQREDARDRAAAAKACKENAAQ
jgi:hypothetical protein